jgi:alpha-beta hydrolase superfamily lysophospholipase
MERAAMQPSDSNLLVIKHDAADAPVLVTFSSVNANGFSFFKGFEDVAASKIFVKDPADAWYQTGVENVAASIDDLAACLRQAVKEVGARRVVMFGTSMGGYAALLFGQLLQADAVVAVSPQSILDPRLPHTPHERFEGPYFDLRHVLKRRAGSPSVHILFGAGDIVDCYNTLRLQTDTYTVSPIREADHLVSAQLAKSGLLKSIVVAALNDEPMPEIEAELDVSVLDPETKVLISKTVERLYLKAEGSAKASATELLRRHPNWSAPNSVLAQLAVKDGDLVRGEAYAKAACIASPGSVTYADYFAQLVMKVGPIERAVDAYEATLRIRPGHYSALCNLAILKSKLSNHAAAVELLDQAIQIRPRLQKAKVLREKILAGDGAVVGDGADKNQL